VSGDTWVALDGSDPDTFTTPASCWVSDVGLYTGPVPVPELPDTTFVPDDAEKVVYLIVLPNPDADDSHVLGTGGYAYTTTNTLEQDYVPPSTVTVVGDPSLLDSGAHLFVLWFPLTPAATAADLPTLTVTPLDLSPDTWVSGGRLTTPTTPTDDPETGADGGSPGDAGPVSFTLHDTDGSLLGPLTVVTGGSWQHELSAPGSLTCRVGEDDPLYADLTPKRIIKAWWRGAARMAARIDSSAVELAVDGRRWREFNQIPGILNTLADGVVYPEFGLDHATSGQRSFGYMSKHGAWVDSGNWTYALGAAYNSSQFYSSRQPEGLSFPNPWWIAKNDITSDEVAGQEQVFRRRFTTATDNMNYQILATADDFLTLWLDGEKLYESGSQEPYQWQTLQQITGVLPAGTHQLAAKVTNMKWHGHNIMGFILTLQQLQASGEVVVAPPVVNTGTSWVVADNGPGFRRGDVLATIFDEARARGVGAFSVLSRGFTHSLDSNGDAWTDDPGEYALDVMSTVLDAVPALTETSIDVDVDFDTLTLQVFNRKGSDLSGTVTLEAGVSLKVDRVERVEAKFNTALVQKSDGTYVEVQDAASVAAYDRIETGLQIGSTASTNTAQKVATAAFLENADTAFTFTVTVSTLAGPQPYVDFGLGDSITLINDEGTTMPVRILTITIDASSELPGVTLEVTVDRSVVTIPAAAPDPSPPPLPAGYDWTANGYGSLYDSRASGVRAAGGYRPHIGDANCGVPTGTVLGTTVAGTSGVLTLTSAGTSLGACTVSASTNKVTRVAHGLANGHPVSFSALTGGAGLTVLADRPDTNWYVVANRTADDFTLKHCDGVTGQWSDVDITADYSAATLVAGQWYDKADVTCYVTTTTSATGLVLFTRSNLRGPAVGVAGTQAVVYNKPGSKLTVILADCDVTPDAPVVEQDSMFGPNLWSFRIHSSHVTDGIGSLGGNHHFGGHFEKAAWFWPNPNHADGSHCDTGMQIHYGDTHVMRGCNVDGYVDATVSSTTDAVHHPIPTRATSCVLVGAATPKPSNVHMLDNDLGGGALALNIAPAAYPNLGEFLRNLIHTADSEKCTFSQGIEAPPSGSGFTIHASIPSTGADANRTEAGTVLAPYVASGNTLTWP
jgi:hypothetical protein